MADALSGIYLVLTLLIATCVVHYVIKLGKGGPHTVKGRAKARLKKAEEGLRYSEKRLLETRLEKLEASKKEVSPYDASIKHLNKSIDYYRLEIRVLKELLE